MKPEPTWTETLVTAEDAPVGVQIWPTNSPEYAPNFTLMSVEVVTRTLRDASGTYDYAHVVWTYENGTTRQFNTGDQVLISLPTPA